MNTDDRRLIEASRDGDSSAFGELVRRYQERLFNAIVRVVESSDDALDVVQEAFINAYQSLRHFKGDSEFYTWLYRIAFNAAISHRRKRKIRVISDQSEQMIFEPVDVSVDNQPGSTLQRLEDEWKVNQAIAKLSIEHRSVLVLKDIEGLKYEEMAEILDVPIGTIRSRLHRARIELKTILEQLWPGEW